MSNNELVTQKEQESGNETLFSGLPEEIMQTLTPAKVRMILLHLTGQYNQVKIAKIIGVSDNTIRSWLVDPNVQLVVKELQAREFAVVDSTLKAMRYKALSTMDELLESDMDNVRYQAAKDVLDRGGHKAQQNIKVEKTVTSVEQQLASLADFTIDESEVIDIDVDDILDEIKNG